MDNKVWIESKNGSLRLRWRFEGKRYCLGLGVKDTPTGRALADRKKGEIQMDLIAGYFDRTLLKYKCRKLGKNPTEIAAVELIEKYAADRQSELSKSSIGRFKAIASKLTQLLGDMPAAKVTESVAKDAIARWSETAANTSIKTYLFLLRACWDWGKGKYHLADSNPWSESLDRVKIQPSKQKKPFTIPELQAIVSAFTNHPDYCYYTEFVIFLAHTACRFGEAAGLRWESIGADYSTAWIGESISRGVQNKKGTKTGKTRTIQLSPTVRSMLTDRRERTHPQPTDLVFPSPKGLSIDDHNFNNRAWKTILELCQIDYRSPYNLRHSAISHALHNGANPVALAEQTGHDKRVLLSTYAHAIDRQCLFVDLGL